MIDIEINICPKCGYVFTSQICPVCKCKFGLPPALKDVDAAIPSRYVLSKDVLNDVLGGGVVQGSILLLSGSPGSGKSTLLLQTAADISRNCKVLYFSLEEDVSSVKARTSRLGLNLDDMVISTQNCINKIIEEIKGLSAGFVIIDSLQMITNPDKGYPTPGAAKIAIRELISKCPNTTFFIVSHVNKSGVVSGSRFVEHMVDVVLNLSVCNQNLRELVATKNRFGQVGIKLSLKMTNKGFV